MKITLKKSLSYLLLFSAFIFVITELFGIIVMYLAFSLIAGYLIGDALGFDRGKKSGCQEARTELEENIERTKREQKHIRSIQRYAKMTGDKA